MVSTGAFAGVVGLAACSDGDPPNLVRKTIGPRGGLISSHDRVLTLVLQPGALARDVEIEVFPSDEPPPIFGPAYRVRPQLELLVDAEVTYRRVLPSNPNAATVGVIRLDDYTQEMGYWRPLPRLALSVEQQSVIAIDDELSLYYGLLEDADAPPLPTDDGNPPATDEGPSSTSGPTTGGLTSGDTTSGETTSGDTTSGDTTRGPLDDGETTMGVDPTTGGAGSEGPASTTAVGSTGMGMSTDDGMVVPMCGDGMPQPGELCLVTGGDALVGLAPIDVGLGDLDGNGTLDLVTLDSGTLEVGVVLGNGDGTFGAPGMGTPIAGMPTMLEVGDFTGDGVLDVVVLDTSTDAVLLLVGDGAGGLAAPIATPTGAGLVDLAGADYDGNAARDLTVLSATDSTVQMLLGGPGGLVAGPAAPVGAMIDAAVTSGSFNPGVDAFADMMGVGVGAAGFDAWATDGLGTGYIGEITGAFGAGGTFVELVAGDIDGDGDDDVLAIDTAGAALVFGLSSGGAANFAFAAPLAVGIDPSDVVLADLDGDGDLEAVVCNATSASVMVFAWEAGAFALAFTFDTGTTPSGVAVGDLDGDGVPDLVVANAGSDTVTVVLSSP